MGLHFNLIQTTTIYQPKRENLKNHSKDASNSIVITKETKAQEKSSKRNSYRTKDAHFDPT